MQAIIKGKADMVSVIHTDRWRGYDSLVDVGFDNYLQANNGKNEFARGNAQSTGLEASKATPRGIW